MAYNSLLVAVMQDESLSRNVAEHMGYRLITDGDASNNKADVKTLSRKSGFEASSSRAIEERKWEGQKYPRYAQEKGDMCINRSDGRRKFSVSPEGRRDWRGRDKGKEEGRDERREGGRDERRDESKVERREGGRDERREGERDEGGRGRGGFSNWRSENYNYEYKSSYRNQNSGSSYRGSRGRGKFINNYGQQHY